MSKDKRHASMAVAIGRICRIRHIYYGLQDIPTYSFPTYSFPPYFIS